MGKCVLLQFGVTLISFNILIQNPWNCLRTQHFIFKENHADDMDIQFNTIQTEHILFQDYPEITWRGIFSLVNIYVGKAPPSLPAQLHLLKLWKETNFSQRTNCSRNLAAFPLQKHNDYGAFRLHYSYLHSYCCWQTLRFLLIVPNNKPAMHRYSNQSLSWYI